MFSFQKMAKHAILFDIPRKVVPGAEERGTDVKVLCNFMMKGQKNASFYT